MFKSLPISESLPTNIASIIGQYENSTNYLTLSNINPLARNETIIDELANINLDLILQFKLAAQLAVDFLPKHQEYLQDLVDRNLYQEAPISRPDPQTLIGIFLPLLKVYSSEYLSSEDIFKNLPAPIVNPLYENIIDEKLIQYIEGLIKEQETVVEATIADTKYIFSLIDPKYKNIIDGIITDDIDIRHIFKRAYEAMIHYRLIPKISRQEEIENLNKYQIVYTTVSISDYIPLFEKYLDWVLQDYNVY